MKSAFIESASYRSTPPESLLIRLADISHVLPAELLLREIEPSECIDVPTGHIFAHIVPTLCLSLLAELSPGLIAPASGMVRLPVQRIALAYRLSESTTTPDLAANDFLFRDDIPFPSANLGRASYSEAESHHVEPIVEEEEETLEEPPTSRLAEIFGNLPTFQRVTETTFLTVKPVEAVPMPAEALAHEEIPDQRALQALFLTDESLSTERVMELCGQLPGIQSCVLATENQIIAASQSLPEGLDVAALSAKASAMLRAMQDASGEMGIGDIPAITLHTARGPLSLFQKDHLAMLVFHGDRGFIPGVREKISAVMQELTQVPLALPAPSKEI